MTPLFVQCVLPGLIKNPFYSFSLIIYFENPKKSPIKLLFLVASSFQLPSFFPTSSILLIGKNLLYFLDSFFYAHSSSPGLIPSLYLFFSYFLLLPVFSFFLIFFSLFLSFLSSFSSSRPAFFPHGSRLLQLWLPIWSVQGSFHGSRRDLDPAVDVVTPLSLFILFLLLFLSSFSFSLFFSFFFVSADVLLCDFRRWIRMVIPLVLSSSFFSFFFFLFFFNFARLPPSLFPAVVLGSCNRGYRHQIRTVTSSIPVTMMLPP